MPPENQTERPEACLGSWSLRAEAGSGDPAHGGRGEDAGGGVGVKVAAQLAKKYFVVWMTGLGRDGQRHGVAAEGVPVEPTQAGKLVVVELAVEEHLHLVVGAVAGTHARVVGAVVGHHLFVGIDLRAEGGVLGVTVAVDSDERDPAAGLDRKSTRLNSSHLGIS